MTASDPVVEIRDLRFSFDGHAASAAAQVGTRIDGARREGPTPAVQPDAPFTLDLPSLTVGARTHTAIVGASGCGKTTLLRLIVGSLTPNSGTVRTLDRDLGRMTAEERGALRRREIGMVFQSFALLDYLSALDNILLTARLASVGPAERRALRDRAATLADRLGISRVLRKRPAAMSQGERQRTAICRALLMKPGLIVCDEPTGNLDPERSEAAVDLILSEADAIAATVLLVTHDHGLLGRFQAVHHVGASAARQPERSASGGPLRKASAATSGVSSGAPS